MNYILGILLFTGPLLAGFRERVAGDARFISMQELVEKGVRHTPLSEQYKSTCASFPLEVDGNLKELQFPGTFVAELKNAKVLGANGYIRIGDRVLRDTLWDWEPASNPVFCPEGAAWCEVRKIAGRVAVLAQNGKNNYYHWMTEILPRLNLLARAEARYDYLYVPPLKYKFQQESLVACGVDMTKIIEASESLAVEPDVLIVPSTPSRSTISPLWVPAFLNRTFLTNQAYAKSFAKCIFISRKYAELRRVSNENDLVTLLKELCNAQPVVLEDYTIAEQAEIFHNADLIIAPHGAGLTNLVFARPGTKVVELFQYHLDDTFWTLSQQLELDHHCVVALPDSEVHKLQDKEFINNAGRYETVALDLEKIKIAVLKLKGNV